MGGVCLWGTGGTHRACLFTAGLLHMVTYGQDPQILSGGGSLQKPTLYLPSPRTASGMSPARAAQNLLAHLPSMCPL